MTYIVYIHITVYSIVSTYLCQTHLSSRMMRDGTVNRVGAFHEYYMSFYHDLSSVKIQGWEDDDNLSFKERKLLQYALQILTIFS